MKWECDGCGACCEILPKKLLGVECRFYDKEKKICLIYETRPNECRVKTELWGDNFYIQGCKTLKEIQNKGG